MDISENNFNEPNNYELTNGFKIYLKHSLFPRKS